jgi:branched-chain amino acid transport system permease protein
MSVAYAAARPWRGVLPTLGALVLVVVAAFLAPAEGYYLNIFMQAATYAIAVSGIVVVLGYCGQISLAQAAFFGLGAYGVALGTVSLGMGFFPALLLSVLFATILGLLLGLASLQLGGHYLAMVTIAFQEILTLVLTNWIDVTKGPDGVRNIQRPSLFGISLGNGHRFLALCLVALVLVTFAVWRLKTMRLGRAMQAVRDNELAASTSGINAFSIKVIAFGVSALLGSIGGGLFASGFQYISPDQFTFSESVVLLTMALLGGVQSAFGSLIGAPLLIIMPEWLRFLKQIYLAVYGVAVILLMVFLPDGLWGLSLQRARQRARPLEGDVPSLPLLACHSSDDSSEILLKTEQLSKHFGGLKALDLVDLEVRRGSVHALIGPNGSGKTTLINVVTGLYRPTGGRVTFLGHDITHAAPHRRNHLGLARTFQNIRLFRGLTVLENVMIGAERKHNDVATHPQAVVERALAALDFVGLRGDAHRQVSDLSYGFQRYVEVARALAASPEVLLLDEPGAGLNLTEKHELGALLRRLKGHGLTILIIDHDMRLVEQVADYITVLNFGRRIADGLPRDVLTHPDVVAAYLGEAHHEAA